MGTLLEEAGFIYDPDALGFAKLFNDVALQEVAGGLSIPTGFVEQALHRVRAAVADYLGSLPAVLALHSGEQPPNILGNLLTRLTTLKQASKAVGKGRKVSGPS